MFEEKIAELNRNNASAVQSGFESEKRVYTVDEIQDILGVSKTTTYRLIKSGVFHSVRVGGQHRISKKSFDAWLDNPSGVSENSQVCD
ncbi:MAG: helix-turn-helix domain-containing protein [Ruminococcaceae bacterium]|jgi:excisionase family DNA binding protein|nr:helix-turn-helix domain-containing protein [Oscillospiraceae bacterium]